MTDLLQDFESFFIASGLVTPDSIFRDTMLDKPDTAVAIYEYQGANPLPQIAGANRSVQIIARALAATDSKLLARALYNSLVSDNGIVYLTPDRWCMVSLRQPPFRMRVDTSERVIYGFNAGITTYND